MSRQCCCPHLKVPASCRALRLEASRSTQFFGSREFSSCFFNRLERRALVIFRKEATKQQGTCVFSSISLDPNTPPSTAFDSCFNNWPTGEETSQHSQRKKPPPEQQKSSTSTNTLEHGHTFWEMHLSKDLWIPSDLTGMFWWSPDVQDTPCSTHLSAHPLWRKGQAESQFSSCSGSGPRSGPAASPQRSAHRSSAALWCPGSHPARKTRSFPSRDPPVPSTPPWEVYSAPSKGTVDWNPCSQLPSGCNSQVFSVKNMMQLPWPFQSGP